MARTTNPFIVKGTIPPTYFCDREQETEKLIRWLTNSNNIVLIAARRMGKTKLIDHCFNQPEIKEQYYTIFVDILQTTNIQELTYEVGKAVFEALSPVSRKMVDLFLKTVKSLQGEFGFDPISGLPKWGLSLGQIKNPTYTLKEIFDFVEKADKTCIIAIDEFQRIAQYPEKNVEDVLRTYIQQIGNCHFIFSGSERHLLNQMFQDKNRPFYDSARLLPLDKIDREKYISFAQRCFHEFDKEITEDLVARVYDLFDGNTFSMQKTMNSAFSLTNTNNTCTADIIHNAIEEILEDNDYNYRTRLMLMSASQKEVLYAIARASKAMQITGAEFINRYQLHSASSVQSAMRKLIADGWIAESENKEQRTYQLTDQFLALWIQKKYGMGYEF